MKILQSGTTEPHRQHQIKNERKKEKNGQLGLTIGRANPSVELIIIIRSHRSDKTDPLVDIFCVVVDLERANSSIQ